MAHSTINDPGNIIYDCWFDGATEKSNPCKKMGYGSVIHLNKQPLRTKAACYTRSGDRNGTNNYSEYLGLIDILKFFSNNDADKIINIYGDSQMVVDQMNNVKQIKDGIYKWKALEAKGLLGELREVCKVNIKWIPRDQNKEADALSKKGLEVEHDIIPEVNWYKTDVMPF